MSFLLWIIVVIAVLYLLICLAVAVLACRRFSGAWDPMRGLTHATDKLLAPYRDMIDAGRQWLETHPARPVEMTSFDGLRLRARLYENPSARAVLVACHGYRSDGARDFASAMRFYHDHGMSILLIDQRAAGQSEGRYITFGVRESADVRDWCALVQDRYPHLPILLAGISMGASAVLMTADDLPENVAALLADCGYDEPWGEFAYVARHFMTPAAQVLLPGVDLFCRALCGFGLRQKAASRALARTKLPVFFVHGQADGLVPYENSVTNRDACAGPAVLFSVPGADHGMSYLLDPEGYHRAVRDFLREYVFAENTP